MGQIGYFFNIIFTFPIFNVLMLLYHVFGDFGLSIIVLTLIVRLCLFPLTLKQLRSTKATQAIQPLMADIRKKYPDQREQYAAMQRLYKEYNINPMAGCLPLVVQLPILYGMYGAMRLVLSPAGGSISLSQIKNLIYPFLPQPTAIPDFTLRWFTFLNSHWFISLAQPDPTHLLPILAGVATFAQLRMSQARAAQQRASSGTSKQGDMMAQQMQIMSFVMPFVTFFIALNFPAGLALYWTTTSIFSMVQQYFVTGWGSLFALPSFLGGGANTGKPKDELRESSETRRERSSLDRVIDSSAEVVAEKNVRPATVNYSGSTSSAARRRRPQSASARRRGNVPKRNASRS